MNWRFAVTLSLGTLELDVALEGDIRPVALMGPNGAGKSTTMRMLAGCLEPDDGRALIADFDCHIDRRSAQSHLGYLPEGAPAYPSMTARGFVRFGLRARGYAGANLDEATRVALDRAQLGKMAE